MFISPGSDCFTRIKSIPCSFPVCNIIFLIKIGAMVVPNIGNIQTHFHMFIISVNIFFVPTHDFFLVSILVCPCIHCYRKLISNFKTY
uniref:Uncharacterized protein n=1 Tax=Pararge aegeria TaxID=116150 RepID=S4P4Y6_9NEOP